MSIKSKIGNELLIFDGAMGTMLQSMGLKPGELPETWNLNRREDAIFIHKSYLDAGCDIVSANTFGANRFKYDNLEEIIKAGVENAREAVKRAGHGYVALDVGPLGKLLEPMGELPFETAYEAFSEIVRAGKDADLIAIETMTSTLEIKAAVLAAKENSDLPIIATMAFDVDGRVLTGADVEAACVMLEGLGVDAAGFNCGIGPKEMRNLLPRFAAACSLPIAVQPNAGIPEMVGSKTVFKVGADEFAAEMKEMVLGGAAIIGGCCGTTPEHIKKTVELCRGITPLKRTVNRTFVSSYTHAIELGKAPVIIGERINPTGKKRFKQALQENDINYILREGLTQEDSGAHILDVNVGMPGIDEAAMMKSVITALQGVTGLPLQIDTSDEKALEAGIRLYDGKPIINSVNGKQSSMDAVFPLVKKYGGVVVGLTLDENGIPDTAEGRVEIAKKIVAEAEKYGIDKKDIIIDTLTMTVATDNMSACKTLDALETVRKMGINTVLGVSNVSFGLPAREKLNAAFFTLAMERGLSAAIVNPMSAAMMDAYHSFMALRGYDAGCTEYISNVEGTKEIVNSTDITLFDAVKKGLTKESDVCAKKLLENTAPLDIVHEHVIPALDEAGKLFENKKLFLPQLIMAADAAKCAFDVIRPAMPKSDGGGEVIIMATVKGDIHDIGKNIVCVLLENYGYNVVDLGKDVSPEKILDAVKEHNASLLGLSALMTTTVPAMEDTIALVHKCAPDCKVMVGGAVLSPSCADRIHADKYAKDAMAAVRYANEIFGR